MSRTDASISCSSMGSLLVLMPVSRLGLLFGCRRRAHIQTEHGVWVPPPCPHPDRAWWGIACCSLYGRFVIDCLAARVLTSHERPLMSRSKTRTWSLSHSAAMLSDGDSVVSSRRHTAPLTGRHASSCWYGCATNGLRSEWPRGMSTDTPSGSGGELHLHKPTGRRFCATCCRKFLWSLHVLHVTYWQGGMSKSRLSTSHRRKHTKGTGTMFRYSGSFSMIEHQPSLDLLAAGPSVDIDLLSAGLRNAPQVLAIWNDFQSWMTELGNKYRFERVSTALELHTEVTLQRRVPSIHLHMMFDTRDSAAMRAPLSQAWIMSFFSFIPSASHSFSQPNVRTHLPHIFQSCFMLVLMANRTRNALAPYLPGPCTLMLRPGRQVHLSGQSLAFRGCKPHISLDCSQARGRSVRRALDQGHFYLQVEKKGSIFRQTTCPAYPDFHSEPRLGGLDFGRGIRLTRSVPSSTTSNASATFVLTVRTWSTMARNNGSCTFSSSRLLQQNSCAHCRKSQWNYQKWRSCLATVHAAYASPKILGAEWPNAPGEDCLCTVSLWRRSHVWNQLFRGVGARHEGIWCTTAPVCGVWWS